MKKRNTTHGFLFLLVISMFASTSIVFGVEVTDSLTCMNVDESGVATGESTEFLTHTPDVYVRAVFSDILPGDKITFGWEIPGGGGWDSTEITATSETVYWDSIPIEFDLAASFSGNWTVNIYVGTVLLDSLNFVIVDIDDLRMDIQNLLEGIQASNELVQEANDQAQAANDQALLWQIELSELEARTTEIEEEYTAVLAQNLVIQNELTMKRSEFQAFELQYNNLNANYTQNRLELEQVKDDLETLEGQTGNNNTLYLAIGAAVIAILAAAYFYTKSR